MQVPEDTGQGDLPCDHSAFASFVSTTLVQNRTKSTKSSKKPAVIIHGPGKTSPHDASMELDRLFPSGEEGPPHRGLIKGSPSRRNAAKPAPPNGPSAVPHALGDVSMLRSTAGGRPTIIKTVRSWKLLQSKKPNRSGRIQTEDYTFEEVGPLASRQNPLASRQNIEVRDSPHGPIR